ncbi:MAG: YigZ family protein [Halioglobus sp.]
MSLQVPAGECEHEYVVKKSRFIARLVPVQSREDVNAALARARQDYPDARHHCWAYLLGKPADATSAGMNDDGEPAGTAGKPILHVLQHGHLGNALVIVIRYFGGIKLGAAGLVRAYSAATGQLLETAPSRTLRHWKTFQLQLGFGDEQPVRHFLSTIEGEIDSVDYGEGVKMLLRVAQEHESTLAQFCAAQGIVMNDNTG